MDGNLSILNYNIDEYGLINVLEGRIGQFESNLEANGLSPDDVRDVSYDYIKEYV